MSQYRKHLPQLEDDLFMTDGGTETTLIFHDGIDLPYFAAFDLLKNEAGIRWLRDYYDRYTAIAREHGLGIVLESPTWRASADWGETPSPWPAPTAGRSGCCWKFARPGRRR